MASKFTARNTGRASSARRVVAQKRAGEKGSGKCRRRRCLAGRGRSGEHLAGDQPGIEFTSGRRPGITKRPELACVSRTTRTTIAVCGSGRCSPGYDGLDLAVEEVFDARTIWFSEINEPVARVFAHHWPEAANLGDITAIDWSMVEPVDVLCGGFPCQDVSTVGKRAGLGPGTRSGLWAHMATAIDALQPEWVVIENVRGLLSAPAIRATSEGDDDGPRNPDPATRAGATAGDVESDPWYLGESAGRPLRAAGAVLGDLVDLGMTRDGSVFPLP